MRIWIDIANSPHSTFFPPIVDELRRRGGEVRLTCWERAQTEELARSFWPEVEVVGAGSNTGIIAKGLKVRRRASALRAAMTDDRPDVALSHNSYSQIIAARGMRLPIVTMMDYEHQPANHLAFRLATRVIVPEAFPAAAVRRFGAARKLLRYPGFKEEITLTSFRPDPAFRGRIGLGPDEIVAAVRPPPQGALYHRGANPLFDAALRHVLSGGATALLSPRDEQQASRYARWKGLRVLDHAVSGANLLHASDLVIGAGGTMTREAAVMGTPSYTVFAGRLAAVDRSLISAGRLVHLDSESQLDRIAVRHKPPGVFEPDPKRLGQVVDVVELAVRDACKR